MAVYSANFLGHFTDSGLCIIHGVRAGSSHTGHRGKGTRIEELLSENAVNHLGHHRVYRTFDRGHYGKNPLNKQGPKLSLSSTFLTSKERTTPL
jgi:hypothetical protein